MLDFFFPFFSVAKIYNPQVMAESGLLQTFTDHFNTKVKVHRFKVHTCLDVHSCCKEMKVSTVHAGGTNPVKTFRAVHDL